MTSSPIVTPEPAVPYARPAPVLTFALLGVPATQGSLSYKGQSKSGRAIMAPSSKALKPWRAAVTTVIREAMARHAPDAGWPLLGPVAVDLVFTVRKPVSAPKRTRTWPAVKPDVDKLARAILDSGTAAELWGDDGQVVDLHAFKTYPNEAPLALRAPGLYGRVYALTPQAALTEQLTIL